MNDINLIVKQFAPIIYLHHLEKYFPVDANDYLSECNIYDKKTNNLYDKTIEKLDSTLFGKLLKKDKEILEGEKYYVAPIHGLESKFVHGSPQDLHKIPLYVKTKIINNVLYITYCMFYGYNGSTGLFKSDKEFFQITSFNHFCDIEHITVSLKWTAQERESFRIFLEMPKLLGIYFSRHNGGKFILKSDLEFEGNRPVIYSALHSHASYDKEDTFNRFWGFVGDKCVKGIKWVPELFVNLKCEEEEFVWMNLYKGYLGGDSVVSFKGKDWWEETEENEHYGENCWFCCKN